MNTGYAMWLPRGRIEGKRRSATRLAFDEYWVENFVRGAVSLSLGDLFIKLSNFT